MSKFFKALERAAEERALRQPTSDKEEQPEEMASVTSLGTRRDRSNSDSPCPVGAVQTTPPYSRIADLAPKRESERQYKPTLDGPLDVDPCLVSLLFPTSFEAEQYRTLRYMVEGARIEDDKCQVVAVSSAAAGDGKTTTAINLAGALAQGEDTRVLLVDTDIRHPSTTKMLGVTLGSNPGLVDAILIPTLSLHDIVYPLPVYRFSLLPVGRVPTAAYEVLKSARLGDLLKEARRAYDYIVLDTPPLVPLPDCRLIAEWVDGFLIVVAAHKTPRKIIEKALHIVDPSQVLGLVFNRDDVERSDYYYSYGTSVGSDSQRGWVQDFLEKIGRFGENRKNKSSGRRHG